MARTLVATAPPHVVDAFLTPDACRALIATHQDACTRESASPARRAYGTWQECACWHLKEIGTPAVGALLDDLRERIVRTAADYFVERAPLALDFTNLTALGPGAFHPLHADYERQGADGTWGANHTPFRKYAAMLYLNTSGVDYVGGALCFPALDLRVQPQAGRLVVFSGGRAHVHETTPVVRGMRYAIATWLTLNPALFEVWP